MARLVITHWMKELMGISEGQEADLQKNLLMAPCVTDQCPNNIYIYPLKTKYSSPKSNGASRLYKTLKGGKKTLHKLSYLDQIATLCLASQIRPCSALECEKYRVGLDRAIPACESWPGFRQCILQFAACALSHEEEPSDGLANCTYDDDTLMTAFVHFAFICIIMTTDPKIISSNDSFVPASLNSLHLTAEFAKLQELWPKDNPMDPNSNTFCPLGIKAIDVIEVVSWLRNCDLGYNNSLLWHILDWYHPIFRQTVSDAVIERSKRVRDLGFCQKRVWGLVHFGPEQQLEIMHLVAGLERFPSLSGRLRQHDRCTPGFCDFAIQNFTSVPQLHKCANEDCQPTSPTMFQQNLLVDALGDGSKETTTTTAWTLDGLSLVPIGGTYLAISHVWSDGTGVGAWKAGQVNSCLWNSFVEIAKRLKCDGIWWDTICIPQESKAKAAAINNMHVNFEKAKYTLVHDDELARSGWAEDGSPCIALVLSSWFTRGWTALELLLSEQVFVMFYEHGKPEPVLKDLHKDMLVSSFRNHSMAHCKASEAVWRFKSLRPYKIPSLSIELPTVYSLTDLLLILRPRYTSWSSDQSIIAGLMSGLTDHTGLPEEVITKQIIIKLGGIHPSSLFHGLPTIQTEAGSSWCPPRILDLLPGIPFSYDRLVVHSDFSIEARWRFWQVPTGESVLETFMPNSSNIYIKAAITAALLDPEHCAVLVWPDSFQRQGILVRVGLSADEIHNGLEPTRTSLRCRYVGCVNFPTEIARLQSPHHEAYITIEHGLPLVDCTFGKWVSARY